MKRDNRTYQVYVCYGLVSVVLERGDKKSMFEIFNACKNDPEYECVILSKWSVKYHAWQQIEKHYNY